MPDNALAPLYLDDLSVGQRFLSGTFTLSEDCLKGFARAYDPQPFHLDDIAARATLFGGLAASGWQTAAITMKLLVEGASQLAGGIIGAGAEIRWPRPTRAGDTLQVESEVVRIIAPRARPRQGVVVMRNRTRNQDREIVQVMTARLIVFSRS
ncbi:MaoC family dehydratase [Oceanicella sp. SM1341]|uniref:MaoC family dehydratase n=1 Tax=Oceanicella sp. SM1341 TaxID=1548889 RepID=UPI000E46C15D|nr:MaoC family dehydratase [Oceanicella sp. SM1341]